ncbi:MULTISPECIES: Asp23/Gls24 family envelope stress response protein [unclassified Streptomyces]|uniref:Asp23/Gls24 family envelope stress response protein n=1 Tax=unclassified Streptomyces TaxID=2593676 RepID=UPI0029A0F754|nr:Asp23/Gls24 family envelope stress response protein [Streptomyces sp. DK15]MDX2388997.1 Asp23/Gls24 family envelope stress response protein [Streptomyces sp. DK15]
MTTRENPAEQAAARIAEAVLAVPGVAFMRPGLVDLLRSHTVTRAVLGSPKARPGTGSGVRITRTPGGHGTAVEVYVVLRHGHRALDVTRAVRDAVHSAHPAGPRPMPVRVTVTGIV